MIRILDRALNIDGRTNTRGAPSSVNITKFTDKKGEFYKKIGFNVYSDDCPEITYYTPNRSLFDCNGGHNESTCTSELQIFYETCEFDIAIDVPDCRYAKYKIISTDSVTLNGNKIGMVDNDIRLTINYVVRQCITEIMNKPKTADIRSLIVEQHNMINEYKSKLDEFLSVFNSLKSIIIEQQQQIDELKNKQFTIGKSVAHALGIEDNEKLKSEINEYKSVISDQKLQLDEYKKSMIGIKNCFSTLNF